MIQIGNTIYKVAVCYALVTAFILLLPFFTMQFTDEVVWDLADFAVAGALLFGAGLTYEMVVRKRGSIAYRAAFGVGLGAMFVLIWVGLAVGIFGPPDPFEFLPAFVVGSIGAIIARFQAYGMARVLIATAVFQALAAVIALTTGAVSPVFWPKEILLNGFFVSLFVGSAWLFRYAAREESSVKARHWV